MTKPSRTAWAAAVHRAAHQILEKGSIFADPIALRILGEEAETITRESEERMSGRRMRLFVACRSRFAEDALAAAIENGVRQLVVLGAGLDTFAYRNPYSDRLHVFEVDHPATQDWKRQRLQDAGISVSSSLTFIPVDFEQQTLATEMAANSSFDPLAQTFFAWLGVVPYLTEEAIWSTLDFVASLPGGAHVVFDYSDPPDTLPPDEKALHEERGTRVSALGEPWITHFTADELRTKLATLGFRDVEDLGPSEIRARYLPHRPGITRDNGGHYLRATTIRDRS